jgi:hypothetical protein
MKYLVNTAFVVFICSFFSFSAFSQKAISLEDFTSEISKGIPEDFEIDENGTDKGNLYAIFMKSPQEVITVNLQKDNRIEFPEQENLTVNNHKAIFYYAGFEKSGGLVVFLSGDAGFLVFGYNKPYMGEEIVEKEELIQIVKNIDLSKFE